MEYDDIIRDNCANHCPVQWWPKFAFHYTDISNAVSILDSGYLYSRATASKHGLMKNDNASRQVIDMTKANVVSKVRFYFRPLTPTQYYNEGYKHKDLRYDNDENANVPVPVFLIFDLAKLLSIPQVHFSETTQAGNGTIEYSGIDSFRKLNFDYIYDNSYNKESLDATKAYRHAEITIPNSLEISKCISYILCRSNLERTTILNMLMENNFLAFSNYKDKIKVADKDTFEYNGFFVTNCDYYNNVIGVSFSDTYSAKRYAIRMMEKNDVKVLKPIRVSIKLKWRNAQSTIYQTSVDVQVDVMNPGMVTVKGLPSFAQARILDVKIYFDDKLMCYTKHSLEGNEVWK